MLRKLAPLPPREPSPVSEEAVARDSLPVKAKSPRKARTHSVLLPPVCNIQLRSPGEIKASPTGSPRSQQLHSSSKLPLPK